MTAGIWPLFDPQVSPPGLSLRYVTDDLGAQLAELAAQGVHDPATMSFTETWTDAPAPELPRNSLRYYWRCRGETCAQHWDLNLAALDPHGRVVVMCTLHADAASRPLSHPANLWQKLPLVAKRQDGLASSLTREFRDDIEDQQIRS